MQADINAFGYTLGTEIKVPQIITPQLCAERIAVSRNAAQGNPQQHFTHSPPIKRRSVDEIQAAIESDADTLQSFVELNTAKFLSQRRSTETENGKFKACFAEWSGLHDAMSIPITEEGLNQPMNSGTM